MTEIEKHLEITVKLFRRLMNIKPKEYPELTSILSSTNMNDIYLSSDIHFGKSYMMDAADRVIARNNSVINNNSILIYLGDLGYKRMMIDNGRDYVKDCAQKLNKGKYSIFVYGNHDYFEPEFYINECGFSFICDSFIYKDIIFSHIPIKSMNNPNNLINIHGHLHDMDVYTCSYFPDSVYNGTYYTIYTLMNDCYPYRLSDVLLKIYKEQSIDSKK